MIFEIVKGLGIAIIVIALLIALGIAFVTMGTLTVIGLLILAVGLGSLVLHKLPRKVGALIALLGFAIFIIGYLKIM